MKPGEGFQRRTIAGGELWLAAGFEQVADELGLERRSRWDEHLAAGVRGGRGKVAFVGSSAGPLVLKQLRRGGLAGPIWQNRFRSRQRLMDNLTIPALARERGVATPPAIALLLVPSRPALWRGWIAVLEIPDAVDLIRRVRAGSLSHDTWAAAFAVVRRLHDVGIEHPDLNLGNLLIDAAGAGWIVDLDNCRVHAAELGSDRRIDGIRRIERSYHKTCFLHDLAVDTGIDWLELYSAGDRSLDAEWKRRRDRDSARLRRHLAGWRKPPARDFDSE